MMGNQTETERWTDWVHDEREWKMAEASGEKQTCLTVAV